MTIILCFNYLSSLFDLFFFFRTIKTITKIKEITINAPIGVFVIDKILKIKFHKTLKKEVIDFKIGHVPQNPNFFENFRSKFNEKSI